MKPTTARVLRTLQDAERRGATTAELCQPDVGGVRFAARLHELRHEHGFEIAEERIRQGSSRYTLIGSAAGSASRWPSSSVATRASRRSGETLGVGAGNREGTGEPQASHSVSPPSTGRFSRGARSASGADPGELPRRIAAPPPYVEPPDTEHEWALVWDYQDGPNCGCSYWERPAGAGEQLRVAA